MQAVQIMPDYLIKMINENLKSIPKGSVLTFAEIVGEDWEYVRRKRSVGILFKRLVLAGRFRGLKFLRRRSDGHMLYLKTSDVE